MSQPRSAEDLANATGTGKIDKAQRASYLRSKGVAPDDQYQLDLLYPQVADRNDLRHIPNDYARSSLFTTRGRNIPRITYMREKLYHYNEYVTLTYTGIELRAEDDEIVWLQILSYGRDVPMGQPYEFTLSQLIKDIKWHRNGSSYRRARECISRLKANEVLTENTKAYGKSGAVSLIHNYVAINDESGEPTHYRVWIDPNLIVMFAGNTFTSHSWDPYLDLSPTARRLADHVGSHRTPLPLALEKFKTMCFSSNKDTSSWRQTVRKACAELIDVGLVKAATLNKQDQIICIR